MLSYERIKASIEKVKRISPQTPEEEALVEEYQKLVGKISWFDDLSKDRVLTLEEIKEKEEINKKKVEVYEHIISLNPKLKQLIHAGAMN